MLNICQFSIPAFSLNADVLVCSYKCQRISNIFDKIVVGGFQEEYLLKGTDGPDEEDMAFEPRLVCLSVRL